MRLSFGFPRSINFKADISRFKCGPKLSPPEFQMHGSPTLTPQVGQHTENTWSSVKFFFSILIWWGYKKGKTVPFCTLSRVGH